MADRILVRLPKELEYVLPAIAVTQGYITRLIDQANAGQRQKECWVQIELQDESHMFLSPMMDRLEWVVWDGREPRRWDWDCVLDFRSTDRALRLASTTGKHIIEAWGGMVGAITLKVPYAGYLKFRLREPTVEILIDERVECCQQLARYVKNNHAWANVWVKNLGGMRVADVFNCLNKVGIYVGPRSGESYLAATMGKALLELYSMDMPLWWLRKPACDIYRVVYRGDFPAEIVWCELEEIWQTMYASKNLEGLGFVGVPESTVGSAVGR